MLLTLIASAFDVAPAALKPLREKIGHCLVDCDFLSNRRSTGITYKIEKQIQIVWRRLTLIGSTIDLAKASLIPFLETSSIWLASC